MENIPYVMRSPNKCNYFDKTQVIQARNMVNITARNMELLSNICVLKFNA